MPQRKGPETQSEYEGLVEPTALAEVFSDLVESSEDADYQTIPVHVIGLSFHTAALDIRGRVGFAGAGLEKVLRRCVDAGFEEALLLSTCNRTELYFVGGCREEAERILMDESSSSFEELRPFLYAKSGRFAAKHLFMVASGLDSAVLGETEILAQLKSSVAVARKLSCIGRNLDFLVRRSQSASRRVRSETELCRNVTSIGSLAVRDAAARIGGLQGKTIVVAGAGKIAERIAKDLVADRFGRLVFVNRTYANAAVLARRYGGEAQPISELEQTLSEADVFFAATSTDKAILDHEVGIRIGQSREGRSLMVIDLGVPPNVHASVADLPTFDVLDMDELVERCSANSRKRLAAVPRAMEIVEEEMVDFLTESARRAASPTIEALVKYAEGVRSHNMEWADDRLAHLSEKDRKTVSDLTLRMVRGFLQSPIRELTEELAAPQSLDLIAKLFRLDTGGTQDR